MKKFVSFFTAAAAVLNLAASVSVSAANEEKYIPLYYFKVSETENINVISEDTVHITRDVLKNGDFSMNIGVYIEDEIHKIYFASAKWRSESEYITLDNLLDPTVTGDEYTEYITSEGNKFTTNLTPFCFAEINSDSTMKIPYTPQIAVKPEINSMYFSYMTSYPNPFSWLGASSYEYAFTSFDAVFDSTIPDGVYDIVFATPENTKVSEGEVLSGVVSHGGMALSQTNFYSFYPEVRNLRIIVSDSFMLGDANIDGRIDAVDASLVLSDYALTATGGESSLNEIQQAAAEVNKDGNIDAIDASAILSYYAYTATGGTSSLEDFLSK